MAVKLSSMGFNKFSM